MRLRRMADKNVRPTPLTPTLSPAYGGEGGRAIACSSKMQLGPSPRPSPGVPGEGGRGDMRLPWRGRRARRMSAPPKYCVWYDGGSLQGAAVAIGSQEAKFTNRLAKETSPYLLQHAHNPVDWYAWGPEAFEASRSANKPIFLSVGYSTCYW